MGIQSLRAFQLSAGIASVGVPDCACGNGLIIPSIPSGAGTLKSCNNACGFCKSANLNTRSVRPVSRSSMMNFTFCSVATECTSHTVGRILNRKSNDCHTWFVASCNSRSKRNRFPKLLNATFPTKFNR